MDIQFIIRIFGGTINSLQLCQCVREASGNCNALDRVILHRIYGLNVPAECMDHSYGRGVTLNDILDAAQIQEAA